MVSVTNKSAPAISTTGNFVSLSLLSGSVQQENGIISRDLTVRRAHSTMKDITCFDFHSTELKRTGGAISSRANVESLIPAFAFSLSLIKGRVVFAHLRTL
jgi:hypothetical protein